jgi:hypothetical protein
LIYGLNPDAFYEHAKRPYRSCEVKMRMRILILSLVSVLLLPNPFVCFGEDQTDDEALRLVADDTYRIGPGDSREKYEALALFGARYKAAALAAKYLAHKGLLEHYGRKEKEIFCLAANTIHTTVIENRLVDSGKSYYVKIRARARSIDFIRAEIQNLELEKKETKFSWKEEMEQHVYTSVSPALELSRAYRYFRKKNWRIAIIYLDHLVKKYPNWGDLYLAKAIGNYATHNLAGTKEALKTACSLGNREACEDLEGLNHSPDKKIKLY